MFKKLTGMLWTNRTNREKAFAFGVCMGSVWYECCWVFASLLAEDRIGMFEIWLAVAVFGVTHLISRRLPRHRYLVKLDKWLDAE